MKFATTLLSLALALALGVLSAQTVLAGAAPPAANPGAFMGDFNNDGRQDVLISNAGDLWVYVTATDIGTGGPNVNIAASGRITTLPQGASVKGVSDFNNDGFADVLVETAGGGLSVLLTDGGVTPVALVTGAGLYAAPPGGWGVMGAADANADGSADVYVQDGAGAIYTYITMDNAGNPQANGGASGSPVVLPANWGTAVVGDINGDGLSDMLAANSVPTGTGGSQIYVFVTAEDGISVDGAASGNPGETPAGWFCCAAGNTTPATASNDLAAGDESGGAGTATQLFVYAMNEDGISFDLGASAANVLLPAGWGVEGLGDFNDDDIVDTLAVNDANGSLVVFLNSAPGVVSGTPFLTQMPNGWSVASFQGMAAGE